MLEALPTGAYCAWPGMPLGREDSGTLMNCIHGVEGMGGWVGGCNGVGGWVGQPYDPAPPRIAFIPSVPQGTTTHPSTNQPQPPPPRQQHVPAAHRLVGRGLPSWLCDAGGVGKEDGPCSCSRRWGRYCVGTRGVGRGEKTKRQGHTYTPPRRQAVPQAYGHPHDAVDCLGAGPVAPGIRMRERANIKPQREDRVWTLAKATHPNPPQGLRSQCPSITPPCRPPTAVPPCTREGHAPFTH